MVKEQNEKLKIVSFLRGLKLGVCTHTKVKTDNLKGHRQNKQIAFLATQQKKEK